MKESRRRVQTRAELFGPTIAIRLKDDPVKTTQAVWIIPAKQF